jgi:hypothetical protein
MDRQIDIGKNSHFVIEVLDLIDSKALLHPSNSTLSNGHIIDDLELAKFFAWDKVYGQDEFTWSDIRSEKMSEVWEIVYEDENHIHIDRKLSAVLEEVTSSLERQLDTYHKELLDDIASDMKGCIYSRAFQGVNSTFFEKILTIYQDGGWPCGWHGDWPEGEISIYKQKRTTDSE